MGTSKRTMINQILKATNDLTARRYSDSAWEGVNNIISVMNIMLASFSMLNKVPYEIITTVEHGGYRSNKEGQTWKEYKVSIVDESDKEVIGGVITANPCGTMSNPWKYYDLTLQLW